MPINRMNLWNPFWLLDACAVDSGVKCWKQNVHNNIVVKVYIQSTINIKHMFWLTKWGLVCSYMIIKGLNHIAEASFSESSPLSTQMAVHSFSVFIVLETYLWLLCCIVGTISSPRLSLWGNLCVQKDEKRFRFIPEV